MKLSFWDILASMVMLGGLALATIFINIFINPYSFINPFPPPTPVASLQVPTLTPSQRSLPELWTATPETPGVPSVTRVNETVTITVTGTRLVLPTGTATSTRTKTPTPSKSITNTPNRTLTSIAYKTPTKTSASGTDDSISPTTPGHPLCYDPSSDSTPTWTWEASTDSGGSGLKGYQITWGTDSGGNNPIYTTTTNSWTAPVLTTSAWHYIYVRAVDNAGNQSQWSEDNSFSFLATGVPSVTTSAASNITSTSATLRGIVSSNGSTTNVYFLWGVGSATGNSVDAAESPLASTASGVTVNGNIIGLTAGTTYYYRIHGSNGYGTSSGTELSFTTSRLNQAALTVNDPGIVTYGDTPTLTTAGGSGTGSVTFSASGGGCSVVSSTGVLTITNASGTCSITATKAGDTTYNPATSVARSIIMAKASQTTIVTHVTPSSLTFGSTAVLSITGGSGSGSVTYSRGASSGCSISGTTLSVIDAGATCDITATKATDANYLTATSVSVNVPLSKADQTAITAVCTPSIITYGNTGALSITGGLGGGAVTFDETGSTGCSISLGTTVDVTDATGSCTITATKQGDNNYNGPITSAAITVTLAKAASVITFPAVSATFGTDFDVSASTTNTDDTSINFAITGGSCSAVDADTFHPTGAGSCTIEATGAGETTNFLATAPVTQTVPIAKASQSITFTTGNPSPVASGSTYAPTATASSLLAVSLGASGACTFDGVTVTFGASGGSCTVTANQVGDGNYLPAPPVTQVISIS